MSKLKIYFVMLAIAVLGSIQASPVRAQVGTMECGEERNVEPGMLSEGAYRRLNDAFEKIGEEQYAEAMDELERLADSRLSDYEKASVNQAMGFVSAQREQYERAIEYFREAIRLDKMPDQVHFEMILQVAQLYNAIERYDEALEQLDYWFCVSTEEAKKQAEVWVLKASLHVQKEEYRNALLAIDEALKIREDPPENWVRLKLGMQLELKDYRPAVDTLKLLINMNPDRKEYWVQLSGVYMELDEPANAMSALRLGYRRGLLDRGSEYTQLAGLLQEMKSPRQAAEVLTEGIERGYVDATARNWEMVAGGWYQARELDKALQAYERAGELSDEGKLDFQRASIMAGEENWEGVREAAARALDKGDLTQSQEGNAHLLIGMAEFNLGNLDSAEQAFNRASNYVKLRGAAEQWLNHIRQTRVRMAQS
ncbi:MAG: hypothetical protein RQ741_11600 [Wenzhouxiangellaceae bacterium]|nr:hypothetical protein [Wenzhouxiangellaceae bacterium]